MRLPVIDTVRTIQIVLNPYGEDPEDLAIAGGYYVGVMCPVNGNDLVAGPFELRAQAEEAMAEIYG